LYSPQALSRIQNKVVTFAVAARFGYAESQARGFEHKTHLGQLAPLFASAFLCLALSVPPGALAGGNFRAVFHGPNSRNAIELRCFFRGRTFQVRSTGVGRARISDAPGFSPNSAGNSLRLLTGRLLKAVSFRAAAVSSFPGQF
jgi:hypothetical protein